MDISHWHYRVSLQALSGRQYIPFKGLYCDGFINAAVEVFGAQKLVVDRYHVAKLYRGPLDKLRIQEMARLKNELPAEEYAELKGMMWILRMQHE